MSAFKLAKSENGEFYFTFLDNGKKAILRSEQYTTKSSAQNGIESVRNNSIHEDRYEPKEASNGKWYYNLKASNGQVVGSSTMFSTIDARDTAISYLKSEASHASIQDEC